MTIYFNFASLRWSTLTLNLLIKNGKYEYNIFIKFKEYTHTSNIFLFSFYRRLSYALNIKIVLDTSEKDSRSFNTWIVSFVIISTNQQNISLNSVRLHINNFKPITSKSFTFFRKSCFQSMNHIWQLRNVFSASRQVNQCLKHACF
mgnify:CR=1 FL=1